MKICNNHFILQYFFKTVYLTSKQLICFVFDIIVENFNKTMYPYFVQEKSC